jgi:hypothetical protein
VGQTRVDLQHLLEDIRDAYPGDVEETILTEIVANSLDSGAKAVRFECDPGATTLTVADDGSGMARRELARYHDVAASTKSRGEGIGFAGVGIKLGLLASETVLTETRRGTAHVATSWLLASRHKAPWRWVPPPGLVDEHPTAVRLQLRNPLSPLLDVGFIEATLVRHFEPLLNPVFDELLAAYYPAGVRFFLNGREMVRIATSGQPYSLISVRIGRRRKPASESLSSLTRSPSPSPEGSVPSQDAEQAALLQSSVEGHRRRASSPAVPKPQDMVREITLPDSVRLQGFPEQVSVLDGELRRIEDLLQGFGDGLFAEVVGAAKNPDEFAQYDHVQVKVVSLADRPVDQGVGLPRLGRVVLRQVTD